MVEAKIDTDKKMLFVLLIVLIIGGIFGTYAYFSSESNTETQNVNTGTLSLEFDDSTPIINDKNIVPIQDEEIFTKATKKTFTIKNTSTSAINAKIDMNNIEITEALKSPDFKWALYEGNNSIATGTFETINNNQINLLNNLNLDENTTKTYDLYIWISYKEEPQNTLQGGNLTTTITVSAVQ